MSRPPQLTPRVKSDESVRILDVDETLKTLKTLITTAKERLWLASPYFRPPPELVHDVKDAARRGVRVELRVRKDDNDRYDELEDELRRAGVKVSEHYRLHAKLYASESQALVTSLNLTESSFDNMEVSVLLHGGSGLAQVHAFLENMAGGDAHCIRCGMGIASNPKRPLCIGCYDTWAEFGDPDYPEKLCHRCGKPAKVTFAKPLCRECFRA